MDKLLDILTRESKTITEEFDKASTIGEGTPQEVSEFRENAFRSFISRFYPSPYKITKGKIHDSFMEKPSASIDCLIVNPAHPNMIDSQGKFQLLLADGIDIAIELKPDTYNLEELYRGLRQGISVKELRRIKGPILSFKAPSHLLEYSRQIPFFIFTTKTRKTIEELVLYIAEWYRQNSVSIENQLDSIVIHRVGVVRNIKFREQFYYGWNIPEGEKTGWFFEEWDDSTLAGFLLQMQLSYHSMATVQEDVLKRYVKLFKIPKIQRINL